MKATQRKMLGLVIIFKGYSSIALPLRAEKNLSVVVEMLSTTEMLRFRGCCQNFASKSPIQTYKATKSHLIYHYPFIA